MKSVARKFRWIVQLEPFQRSASSGPFGMSNSPTAVQAAFDVHETPLSAVYRLDKPAAFGFWSIDQRLPFQRSTRTPWPDCPTATQNVLDVHDTAMRALRCGPGGFGPGWIDQLLPFQRSTSVEVL